ncbi:MAG: hypothetical protein ACI841_004563 [Planctomycetota bacterium]|jgi:hypothetical protein
MRTIVLSLTPLILALGLASSALAQDAATSCSQSKKACTVTFNSGESTAPECEAVVAVSALAAPTRTVSANVIATRTISAPVRVNVIACCDDKPAARTQVILAGSTSAPDCVALAPSCAQVVQVCPEASTACSSEVVLVGLTGDACCLEAAECCPAAGQEKACCDAQTVALTVSPEACSQTLVLRAAQAAQECSVASEQCCEAAQQCASADASCSASLQKAATVVAQPIDEEAHAILSALGYADSPVAVRWLPGAVDGQKGFLGVSFEMNDGKATVQTVYEDSAAEKAGLKTGDRVWVKGNSDFLAAVQGMDAGESLKLQVERDGWTKSMKIELGTRPGDVLGFEEAPDSDNEGEHRLRIRSEGRENAKQTLIQAFGERGAEAKKRQKKEVITFKKKAAAVKKYKTQGGSVFLINPEGGDGPVQLKIQGNLDKLKHLEGIEGLHEHLLKFVDGGDHEIQIHVDVDGDFSELKNLKALERLKGLKGLKGLKSVQLGELGEIGVDLRGLESLGIDLKDLGDNVKIGGMMMIGSDGEAHDLLMQAHGAHGIHKAHGEGEPHGVFVFKSDGEGNDFTFDTEEEHVISDGKRVRVFKSKGGEGHEVHFGTLDAQVPHEAHDGGGHETFRFKSDDGGEHEAEIEVHFEHSGGDGHGAIGEWLDASGDGHSIRWIGGDDGEHSHDHDGQAHGGHDNDGSPRKSIERDIRLQLGAGESRMIHLSPDGHGLKGLFGASPEGKQIRVQLGNGDAQVFHLGADAHEGHDGEHTFSWSSDAGDAFGSEVHINTGFVIDDAGETGIAWVTDVEADAPVKIEFAENEDGDHGHAHDAHSDHDNDAHGSAPIQWNHPNSNVMNEIESLRLEIDKLRSELDKLRSLREELQGLDELRQEIRSTLKRTGEGRGRRG